MSDRVKEVLSEFSDEQIEAELSRRLKEQIKGLKSLSQDELITLAERCSEEDHLESECLPCAAWGLYIRRGGK